MAIKRIASLSKPGGGTPLGNALKLAKVVAERAVARLLGTDEDVPGQISDNQEARPVHARCSGVTTPGVR